MFGDTSNKVRRLLRYVGVPLLSTFLSLVVADGVLLLTVMHEPPPLRNLYQIDAARGYALTPGFKGIAGGKHPFPVEINSDGFRDNEWTFDSDFRILVLGSSFTFGDGLPIEDGFVWKIRDGLEGKAQIYNASARGYGPPHLLETMKIECPRVRPRHVFYFFTATSLRRDFLDTSSRSVVDGYLISTVGREGGTPLSEEEIRRRLYQKLNFTMRDLFQILQLRSLDRYLFERKIHPRQLVAGMRGESIPTSEDNKSVLISGEAPASHAGMAARAATYILGMRAEAEKCGARFSMIALPLYANVHEGIEYPLVRRILKTLEPKSIDILDLRNKPARGSDYFLGYDPHYNADGARWVAANVTRYLKALYSELD